MNTVEKIIFLQKVPLFSNLKQDELRLISQLSEERSFKEEEKIMDEKEHEEEFNLYIIISGSVKMSNLAPTPEGIEEEKELDMLGERDSFGDIEVFRDDTLPTATYTTKTGTRVLMVNGKKLRSLLVRYPRIAIEVCKVFSKRIRETNKKLVGAQT